MEQLSIRLYKNEDLPGFQDYISRAFHEKYILRDKKYIDWQYQNSLYLALAGEKIIGHFGFRDLPYKIYDGTITARVLINLFVLEEYRRAGVGALLARTVLDTPNPVLVSGYTPFSQRLFPHLRDRWSDAGNLGRYIAILNNRHSIFAKFPGPTIKIDGNHDRLSEALSAEEAGKLWDQTRGRYPVTVERSAEYINWRFLRHPFFQYKFLLLEGEGELVGYLVYRIEEAEDFRIARIVDCVAKEGAEEKLFIGILRKAKELGIHAVDFMFSGNLYRQALLDAGFLDIAGTEFEKFPILFSPISHKKTFINVGYDIKAPLADFYITKADGDQDRPNPR